MAWMDVHGRRATVGPSTAGRRSSRAKPQAAAATRVGVAAVRRSSARELAALAARLDQLAGLFHRRWSVPVLAELQRGHQHPGPGGAKFITLVKRLGVNRESLRATLDHLIDLGLVMRNPGYGHPMRPEYLLTRAGLQRTGGGGASAALMDELGKMNVIDIALRKWSMPVLFALGHGVRRFGELRAVLAGAGITPRALTLALKDLIARGLVERSVIAAYPPITIYRPTAPGEVLARLLKEI